MPETEKLELRTDSVEQIIEILQSPHAFVTDKIAQDRANAIVDRLEKQTSSNQDAIALCGLPGAGKSKTAEILSEVYDAPVISMGDAIRGTYKTKKLQQSGTKFPSEEVNSKELGEFASEWRRRAPEEIPEKVTEMASEKDDGLIIIEGVRSVTDNEVLRDYFNDFYLIRVFAPFYERLDRLQERGREGEEKFTATDLAERDENERWNLGFGNLCETDCADLSIDNDLGVDTLRRRLGVLLSPLPFEFEDENAVGVPPNRVKRVHKT